MLNKPFLAAFAAIVMALLFIAAAVLIPLGLYLITLPCMAVRILGCLFLGTGSFALLQLTP